MSDQIKFLINQLIAICELSERDYQSLVQRYDDALKRIDDLQAELEFLRQEVNRG